MSNLKELPPKKNDESKLSWDSLRGTALSVQIPNEVTGFVWVDGKPVAHHSSSRMKVSRASVFIPREME